MKAKVSIRVEFKQSQSLKWCFYVTTISSVGEVKVKRFKEKELALKYLMKVLDSSTKFNTLITKSMVITLEKDYAD